MKIILVCILLIVLSSVSYSQTNSSEKSKKDTVIPPPLYLSAEAGIPLKFSQRDYYKNIFSGAVGIYLDGEKYEAIILELGSVPPNFGYLSLSGSYCVFKSKPRMRGRAFDEVSLQFGGLIGGGHEGAGIAFIAGAKYLHRFHEIFGVTAGVKFIFQEITRGADPLLSIGIQLF